MGRDSFAEMKKRGLINIQRTDNPPWGAFRSLSAQYTVTLTDAGKKYLIKETPEKDSAKVQVRTHEFQGVEVVGVGAPSDLLGKKVSIVQYQVEYRSTPFDLDGSGNSKGKGEALFVLYDKGWKLSELH
ncbi:MAG: hypothetical protein HZC22_07840 [Rhodocyclales bacterium]|nr:hypothetical protein [Rhodocyclales bacterium]